jgi:hypothetical protein
LAHPWISGESTPRTELKGVTTQIKEFNNKRRFKVIYIIIYNNNEIESWIHGSSSNKIQKHSQQEVIH